MSGIVYWVMQGVLFWGLLQGGVGDVRPSVDQLYAMAVLREMSERDLAGAAELYRQVIEAAGQDSELKTRAQLRLGLCLHQQGKTEEAERWLELAAAGDSEPARQAATFLARRSVAAGTSRLQTRIVTLLHDLIYEQEWSPDLVEDGYYTSDELEQILWIGEPAVTTIREWLHNDSIPSEGVPRLVYLLVRMGGESANAAIRELIQKADPFMRREMIGGLRGSRLESGALQEQVVGLIQDEDARVRATALDQLSRRVEPALVLAMSRDPDAEVRSTAVAELPFLLIRSKQVSFRHEILGRLEQILAEGNPDLLRSAGRAAGISNLMRDARGARHYLHCMQRDDLEIQKWPVPDRTVREAEQWSESPAFSAQELLDASQVLQRCFADDALERRWISLEQLVRLSLSEWRRSELPAILKLAGARLILGWDVQRWISEHCNHPDAVLVAQELGSLFGVPDWAGSKRRRDSVSLRSLEPWFLSLAKGSSFPVRLTVAQSLHRHLLSLHEVVGTEMSYRGSSSATSSDHRRVLRNQIASLMHRLAPRELAAALHELLAVDRDRAWGALASVVEEAHPDLVDTLMEFLSAPYDSEYPQTRNKVLRRLLQLEVFDCVERLPAAYAAGLAAVKNQDLRGIEWFLTGELVLDGKIPEEAAARALSLCLTAEAEQPWKDLEGLVLASRSNQAVNHVSDLAWQAICDKVLDCPDRNLRIKLAARLVSFGRAGWRQIFKDPRVAEDSSLRHHLVKSLHEDLGANCNELLLPFLHDSSESVVREALKSLGYLGNESLAVHMVPLLSHNSSDVRGRALRSIVQLAPKRALEWIAPLSEDPSEGVREIFCGACATILDRRAVPHLIEKLKDREFDVRQAASKALREIQFYFSQVDTWERWAKGAGLSSSSAAEALLQQAQPSKSKVVRLAAISSLGTLGVPETLPLLVGMMEDSDPDVALAAKEAVTKINLRSQDQP
jgi:HEAT repeat protein